MRIDLFRGGRRPLLARLGLALFKLRAGVYPGPPLAITYRPDLLNKDLSGYVARAMHGSGGWSKGEAEMLNQTGRVFKGKQADPVWVRDVDGHIRPMELARARRLLLSAPGKTTPALRQAVEASVVIERGHTRSPALPVPDELRRFLKKLALYAYKITDEDVDGLRSAGYEDEAIYEVTVAGAFGAVLVGVEKLFDVLYG